MTRQQNEFCLNKVPGEVMSCRHGIRCTEQECLYSPSHWSASSKSPNQVIETFIATMRSCYQENLLTIPMQQSVPYGGSTHGKQVIDIWGSEADCTEAIVLFHGGYWQEGDRKLFTSPVKVLVDEGFVVACVGYDFATTISLNIVVEEATKALHVSAIYVYLEFLAKRWPYKRLSVGGHSAGAHLAISALKCMEDAHRYQKIILFSGIYDLRPLLGTYIGKAINLAEAEALSVVSLDKISAELLVVVGADESPKFKEQSQYIVENYMEKYHAMNMSDCFKIIPNEDHFTLVTSLADKNSTTTRELLRFMLRKQPSTIPAFDSS
uniref:Abhydrolase_3 domain-containing protein n=1 Tax=Onchocerca volvulus TaxID=6282 RepID=A0A8R1XR34_ONCVO